MNITTMFTKFNPFEEEIKDLLRELEHHEKSSKEYAQIMTQLDKIVKMEEERKGNRRISPETWAKIGANLAGIGLILNYEKVGVITTKALGFVLKGRL